MKLCPYCGYSNLDAATACRKCEGSFVSAGGTVYQQKALLIGPEKAHNLRRRALSAVALGLLIRVYWGGAGPWPVLDNPSLASIRTWLEPALLFGGAALYLLGWILNWV